MPFLFVEARCALQRVQAEPRRIHILYKRLFLQNDDVLVILNYLLSFGRTNSGVARRGATLALDGIQTQKENRTVVQQLLYVVDDLVVLCGCFYYDHRAKRRPHGDCVLCGCLFQRITSKDVERIYASPMMPFSDT